MIAYTNTPSFVSDAIQRAALVSVFFVENIVDGISSSISRQKTIAKLNKLDDHELKDIGLTRSSISTAAGRRS